MQCRRSGACTAECWRKIQDFRAGNLYPTPILDLPANLR